MLPSRIATDGNLGVDKRAEHLGRGDPPPITRISPPPLPPVHLPALGPQAPQPYSGAIGPRRTGGEATARYTMAMMHQSAGDADVDVECSGSHGRLCQLG